MLIEFTLKLLANKITNLKYSTIESISEGDIRYLVELLFKEGEINEQVLEERNIPIDIIIIFNELPFVSIDDFTNKISLKEFKTNQLLRDSLRNLDAFLKYVTSFEKLPTTFNNQFEKKVAPQDLRLLGFLSKDENLNHQLLKEYREESLKLIQKQVLNHPYSILSIELLKHMQSYNEFSKKRILVELTENIVRNYRQENPITDSMAEKRIATQISYLKGVGIVDEKLNINKEAKIRPIIKKIMNKYLQEKQSPFKANELGHFVRSEAPMILHSLDFVNEDRYSVQGSVGKGNWAKVPWISILDNNVTTSTQRGYYLVYLFSEDMNSVYLTFAQGITESTKEQMAHITEDIRNTVHTEHYSSSRPIQKDGNVNLGESSKSKGYGESTALYIQYDKDALPSEEELQQDLKSMISIYDYYVKVKSGNIREKQPDETIDWSDDKVIEHIHSYIQNKGFYYSLESVKNLFISLKTKPFVILSGISGTGKTKIIELFAESIGATEQNNRFNLIPVRPDWSDGSDLLGYTDIKGEFLEGQLTSIIKQAKNNPEHPYFVVLDEMNLARVEYYFSDFLSVIESRKWKNGEIQTLPILKEAQLGERLTIPSNLYIVGTVNMDETTHPFSKKVLDRANTIEYNDVHLDTFSFFKEKLEEVKSINLRNQRLCSQYLQLKDAYGDHESLVKDVTDELVKVNKLLEPIQAHVGYRVRDEVCFYVIYSRYVMGFNEALDYQFYQKILPRLTASHGQSFQVLKDLYAYFTNHEYETDISIEQANDILEKARFPRSGGKVYEMLLRGDLDGFTSFWIS
ncbi:McrB family protein [Thalassobacillus hwangdonensis]|uniref:McrB family protein n=1 Tax=Thalassobacillus hwangdonensis TaxID=546108 RepID=A0ABW3L7B6_9BACI